MSVLRRTLAAVLGGALVVGTSMLFSVGAAHAGGMLPGLPTNNLSTSAVTDILKPGK
ncbi:hypothetical protein [Pseudonocardia acaciae]|uniref:hypothetical protein n=1 Tax=Pseudonocardia acaciae TaxID=551276 RepID=UPI000A9102E3|nr:hypothetical protein [Pseudonocardia acaciae]